MFVEARLILLIDFIHDVFSEIEDNTDLIYATDPRQTNSMESKLETLACFKMNVAASAS